MSIITKSRAVRFGLGAALLALTACGGVPATVASPVEAALINALTNSLAPGINQAVANLAGKVTSNQDVQLVGYALPWAKEALDALGPKAGLSTATMAELDAAVSGAEQLLANPPQDVGSAVAIALAAYNQVQAALKPVTGA